MRRLVPVAGFCVVPGPGGLSATFRVKGKFSSGKGALNLTRILDAPAYVPSNCGSGASNPTTSDYLETFTAMRTYGDDSWAKAGGTLAWASVPE